MKFAKIFAYLFFLIACFCTSSLKAQHDTSFKNQWKEIDSLITKDNLTKTAISKVNSLYTKAVQRKSNSQIIKALIYKIELGNKIKEENIKENIQLLETESKTIGNIQAKSILQVLIAKQYFNYYQQNSWQINNRTETKELKKNDIATWAAKDFAIIINKLFDDALQPAIALQATSLKQFDALIAYGIDVNLKPTLYDVLANEALTYFEQNEDNNYYRGRQNTSNKSIETEQALATVAVFLQHQFTDSTQQTKALKLHQHLIGFHQKQKNTDAFINANLSRIQWTYSNAVFDSKDSLYLLALQEITNAYPNNLTATQAWFKIAKFYADKASTFNTYTNSATQLFYKKAVELIQTRLQNVKDTCVGNNNLRSLLQQIEDKKITATTEKVNLPNKPFRVLIDYKNTPTVYYRIIRLKQKPVEDEDEDVERTGDEKFWKIVAQQKFIAQLQINLPGSDNDYQQRQTEIKIDALPAGSYAILGSTGKGFIDSTDKMFYQQFTVSSISYIHEKTSFFVVDRDNGQPLPQAQVIVKRSEWNSTKQKSQLTTILKTVTDKNGFFNLNKANRDYYNSLNYTIIYKNDTLNSSDGSYIYRSTNNADNRTAQQVIKDESRVSFFTDRSIYRPGQTLYFKGIVTTKNKSEINYRLYLECSRVLVGLYDVNNKQVDTSSFTLNEFGSFSGIFKLPLNGLTGHYSIRTTNLHGQINFNVEEYKRPKFFVEFDTLKSSYKLYDLIKITGNAKAYAGNSINTAKVVYTVTRNARFIYPWMFWKSTMPNVEAKQMAFGETVTDAQGNFIIPFKAEPDKALDKNTKPVFDYTVAVSITDINGETREGSTEISVGYSSMSLNIDAPETVDINKFNGIKITAQNLAGQSLLKMVHVKMYALHAEERLIRKRLWQRPTAFTLTKEEYIQNFPYDEYDDETNPATWAKQNLIEDDIFASSKENNNYAIAPSKLKPAYYLIEATTIDTDGSEIKALHYIELTQNNTSVIPTYNNYFLNKQVFSIQDTVALKIQSQAGSIYLIQNIKRKNSVAGEDIEKNNFSFKTIAQNYTWQYNMSGWEYQPFGMYYAFVQHNRIYTGGQQIEIIKPSKDLEITHLSYRNKTLPGAKETYTIQVKGKDGEAKTAELLTAMYDASLDQFAPHNWHKPVFGYYESVGNNFEGNNVESIVTAYRNKEDFYFSEDEFDYSELEKSIDGFSTYKWGFLNNGILQVRGSNALAANSFKLLQGRASGIASEMNAAKGDVYYMSFGNQMESDEKVEITKFTPPKIVKDKALQEGELFINATTVNPKPQTNKTQPRKNFNETAFFFPNLYADSNGVYSFSFTMPEALTQWNWVSLAHTKNLDFGLAKQQIVTQKTLMVQANAPRFLREGDIIELNAKISNTGNTELTGTCTLELIDATTNTVIDGLFNNVFPSQYFTVTAGQSMIVKFPVQVPGNFAKPITYKIIAKTSNAVAGNFEADGEENSLPVLSNRIFITETLPLYVKPNEASKSFTYNKFNEIKKTSKEDNPFEAITVEYTANPVWPVVQSLPYLIEYPYECAEQSFNRLFGNALAMGIVNKYPAIKVAMNKWKENPQLPLQQNEELKNILLTETPWVANAANEEEQQKNIALLFDVIQMSKNIGSALDKLEQLQMPSGGFAWFKGGRESDYITQYILAGIGKLKQTKQLPKDIEQRLSKMANEALQYVDLQMAKEYNIYIEWLRKNATKKPYEFLISTHYQYWYARSFFAENTKGVSTGFLKYWVAELNKNFAKQSVYQQALNAVALYRLLPQHSLLKQYNNLPAKIINSIKENAVEDTVHGSMYFKKEAACYYWYQNNFETHTTVMEALNEVTKDNAAINKLKTWLILNKQTNSWESTIATAGACFAVLNYGNANWAVNPTVEINIGGKQITNIKNAEAEDKIKTRIEAKNILPNMDKVTVSVKQNNANKLADNSPSFGAVYYQFFQDMNDVTASPNNPLSLVKKLFVEKNDGKTKILEPLQEGEELRIGDKLIVRVELRCNRTMEYVHLKDMRASGTEPVNVLSSYKWQDGLGYYESTKDAATNFFIDRVEKGTYVFEYPLYVTHSGTYSVGIATIQCMYAPEFTSHSKGMKIRVK